MGSDTPEYTERELGQRLLIDRIDEVLVQTGRSTGFPGEPVYAGKVAKWGEDGGDVVDPDRPDGWDQTIAGPPALAITRVVRDGRTSDGSLTAEGLLNTYDPQSLVNAFVPKQTLSILDLDTRLLNILVPFVKIYKMYPRPGGDPIPVEFKKDWLRNNPRGTKAFSAEGMPPHKDIRVGLTGCKIDKMGENPGRVDNNIKVQLTVETQDLNNLFYRWKISELEKLKVSAKMTGQELSDEAERILNNGVAWIDLIKMNPKGEASSNSCDLSYDPPKSEIKLVIGYGTPSRSEIRNALYARERKERVWKDPNKAREALKNSALTPAAKAQIIAAAEYNEQLIDEIGEAEFKARLEKHDRPNVDDIIEIIENHREIFYLQLSHHEFVLGSDLQVELKIHYIARSEFADRAPGADLLVSSKIREELARKQRSIHDIKADLGNLQAYDPPAGLDPDSPEYAEIMAQNRDREDCRWPLEDMLKDAQSEYDKAFLIAKKRLYNQLLLKGHDNSRIYKVRIPKTLDLRPSASDQDAEAKRAENPILIRNYRDVWWTDSHDANISPLASNVVDQERLTALANGEEMNDDTDSASDERENLLNATFNAVGSDYYQLNFVFIGDIFEAALELVAYNNDYFGETPVPSPGLVSGRSQQDDMPVTAFYREVASDGALGPLATATIKLLGKYVFGDITLPKRSSDPATRYINIADIPIDIEHFRTYWFNEVVSKPAKTSFFLRDLINGIMTHLIPYALTNRAVLALSSVPQKRPTTRISYFALPGFGAGLNVKLKKEMAPEAQRQNPDAPPANPTMAPLTAEQQELCDEDPELCNMALSGERAALVQYVPYFKTTEIAKQLSAEFAEMSNNSNNTDSYDVVLIQQKPEGKVMRTGLRSIDKEHGIQHYILNVANKKALISATFKRNDLPLLGTANLMQDSIINSRGIIREKYDADVLLRGNVVYKPGAILYLDHTRLQSSHMDADQFNQQKTGGAMLPWALQVSPARAIGLGGYFTVTSVSHDFGHLGTGKKWNTTLATKWLSFEYIEGIPDSCYDQPTAPGSPNLMTTEQCLIDAAEDRVERATKAAKEAREANQAAVAKEIEEYEAKQRNRPGTGRPGQNLGPMGGMWGKKY
jgi:hypothetical protein